VAVAALALSLASFALQPNGEGLMPNLWQQMMSWAGGF